MRRTSAVAAAAWLALACGAGAGERYEGGGVVRGVRPAEGQVTIEHGEIEGLMPAMTMSFDVADPALLEGLAPGQYVEFRLVHSAGRFEIDAITAPGGDAPGAAGVSGSAPDPLARADEPAPAFALVDQHGRPVTLASLRGNPVLLDFVFTRCPGPCPVLTGIHRDVREGLAPEARARLHSVSITLDPAHDTPEVLRAYTEARRLDGDNWSFLTGPVEEVEAVVAAYGVGTLRQPDGNIDHTLATFLIDGDGNIAKRYLGVRHDPAEIRADVEGLL